jgi:hypothetical protein
MYYNNPTVISIIEVVLILVPALLAVAYVTVAERKTMASMQRRLGPNVVGQINRFSIFKSQAGFYHTTSHDKDTEALYKNRKATLIPFEGKVVSVCKDLLSSTAINTFFKGLQGKSGGIICLL